jgi:DNA-binding MarR family transcriptional regulator
MNDELESLVVSGKDMDRRLVAEILTPYVRLDRDGCNIRPLEDWSKLKAQAKILLYLLSRKAMLALDFGLPIEGATAGDVANDTGLKKGTVNPALRELLSDRLIDQAKDGRYFIPNHAIERVKAMLGEK